LEIESFAKEAEKMSFRAVPAFSTSLTWEEGVCPGKYNVIKSKYGKKYEEHF
jgi:hypothetical protein